MRIERIKFSEYKVLSGQDLVFPNESIFPKGEQIVGIIGENGSGKTTFCSLVANAFQFCSIGRPLENFCIIEFSDAVGCKRIEFGDNTWCLYTDGELVHTYEVGKRQSSESKAVHRAFCENFFLGKIVLSTFETRGEYPSKKPSNFNGHDLVRKYDVSSIYGGNLYGFPSMTKGIMRFISDSRRKAIGISAFKAISLILTNNVEVKIVGSVISEYERVNSDWYKRLKEESPEAFASIEDEHSTPEFLAAKDIELTGMLEMTTEKQYLSFSQMRRLGKLIPDHIGKFIFANGFVFKKGRNKLEFSDLSSGEKFFIVRYLSILSAIEPESLIIVEEPETHLNPSWREIFVPLIHKIATEFKSSLIFTTHERRAIRYLEKNNIFVFKAGRATRAKQNTLLCDEFDFESMGGKAMECVQNEIIEVLKLGTIEQRYEIIEQISRVPERISLRQEWLPEEQE